MSSRTLTNIILLVVLLALAGFYVFKNNQPADTNRLTQLSLDEINTIRIPREDNFEIILQKKISTTNEATWFMIKPYSIKAHQFRVNTLLSLTQTPVTESYDSKPLNLSHYALDKPRARIVFNSTEILFGATNPLNNKRYFLSNHKLTLLDDQIYPLVSSQAATFVDLNLLHEKDISSISLPDLKIFKTEDGHWNSSSTNSSKNNLTADKIQSLLDNWRHAQAFAVHRYMPRKQLGKIEITTADSMITFELSDNDPWLIIARADLGIEYHMDSSLAKSLLTPPTDSTMTQGNNHARTP